MLMLSDLQNKRVHVNIVKKLTISKVSNETTKYRQYDFKKDFCLSTICRTSSAKRKTADFQTRKHRIYTK